MNTLCNSRKHKMILTSFQTFLLLLFFSPSTSTYIVALLTLSLVKLPISTFIGQVLLNSFCGGKSQISILIKLHHMNHCHHICHKEAKLKAPSETNFPHFLIIKQLYLA